MTTETNDLLLRIEELTRENSELKQQLVEARSANIAKEAFLSNMSHDIRTPMNAVIGLTALAKKHIDEKDRVSDALNKIEVAGNHLLNLINEVLDMSRIDSGRMELEEVPFALSDLLHDTLVIVRPQVEQKRHKLHFNVDDILYEGLIGDATRLRQIFVNIINNAVKYTNDGGDIRVRIDEEEAGDRVVLIFSCEDNGVGMSEEFLARLFEPFERAEDTTQSGIEGTGLGMSIVRKLLDAMGGTIGVKSAPGQGTAVTIRVPLRYEKLALDTSALKGVRLLIVEASPSREAYFRRFLDEFKIDYTIVPSPSDALAAIAEADYHGKPFGAAVLGTIVDADQRLYDFAAYLRKSNASLPIVLVSKQNWDEIRYHANRAGIDHFIPIPFFRKSLINGLNAALHRSSEEKDGFSGAPDLNGRRILLVEDNAINREIACEILLATNAEVETAENGKEAVDRFTACAAGYFDLILMDIQMPVMDGYAAARAIRASGRPDAETVPIYAMTANIFAEDIAKAREYGMNGHIAKPIDINKLMQTLRQIL